VLKVIALRGSPTTKFSASMLFNIKLSCKSSLYYYEIKKVLNLFEFIFYIKLKWFLDKMLLNLWAGKKILKECSVQNM